MRPHKYNRMLEIGEESKARPGIRASDVTAHILRHVAVIIHYLHFVARVEYGSRVRIKFLGARNL